MVLLTNKKSPFALYCNRLKINLFKSHKNIVKGKNIHCWQSRFTDGVNPALTQQKLLCKPSCSV